MMIPLLKRVCEIYHHLKLSRIQRVCFQCDLWEASFIPSNWVYLDFYSSSWLWFFLSESVVGTLRHLSLAFRILEILCKNKPPTIIMIDGAKKRRAQKQFGGFFAFCKINLYGLKCFRCVWHDLFNRIPLTFIPSGWDFTVLIIISHHPCNW